MNTLLKLFLPFLFLADSAVADMIVDTLGGLSPIQKITIFGTGGPTLLPNVGIGPQFTLAQDSAVTEIGAIVNNCRQITSGVPNCAARSPIVVRVVRSINGAPDLAGGSYGPYMMSDDGDPLSMSYESAMMYLALPAGDYFALFTPQNNDSGYIVATVEPGGFIAPSIRMGVANLNSALTSSQEWNGTFRISTSGGGATRPAPPEVSGFHLDLDRESIRKSKNANF
jgi:hypothetical protein